MVFQNFEAGGRLSALSGSCAQVLAAGWVRNIPQAVSGPGNAAHFRIDFLSQTADSELDCGNVLMIWGLSHILASNWTSRTRLGAGRDAIVQPMFVFSQEKVGEKTVWAGWTGPSWPVPVLDAASRCGGQDRHAQPCSGSTLSQACSG